MLYSEIGCVLIVVYKLAALKKDGIMRFGVSVLHSKQVPQSLPPHHTEYPLDFEVPVLVSKGGTFERATFPVFLPL